mgnify:FL=1
MFQFFTTLVLIKYDDNREVLLGTKTDLIDLTPFFVKGRSIKITKELQTPHNFW